MDEEVKPFILKPQDGLQSEALDCFSDFLLLGGAAGACKTYTLFLDNIYQIENPKYVAVFFRGSHMSIFDAGGLWDTATKIYPLFGGRSNQTMKLWTFPSGTKIFFRNVDCRRKNEVKQSILGLQYTYGYFDEVTELDEDIFWFLVGRCRDTGSGIKPYIRMTCNPKIGWVRNLITYYLDENGYPKKELSGIVRYFVREGDQMIWSDSKSSLADRYSVHSIQSFTFLPGTIKDNKILLENDPGYLARLESLSSSDKSSMLYGCWNMQEESTVFQSNWFNEYQNLPNKFDIVLCCIDTASSREKQSDYSAATIWWGYVKPENELATGELYLIDLIRKKVTIMI
jgi:hypothetical protein